MAANDYAFLTHWSVPDTTLAAVYNRLADAREYPRWWPEVYLHVESIAPGDARGIGASARLLTRGWLPYRLRWTARVIETSPPHGFTIEATGDFVGLGTWRFTQNCDNVNVTFDWRLRAEKPLLRHLSWMLKPIFSWNHRWAMSRGEIGLRRELRSLE